jgi:hypothetical protein
MVVLLKLYVRQLLLAPGLCKSSAYLPASGPKICQTAAVVCLNSLRSLSISCWSAFWCCFSSCKQHHQPAQHKTILYARLMVWLYTENKSVDNAQHNKQQQQQERSMSTNKHVPSTSNKEAQDVCRTDGVVVHWKEERSHVTSIQAAAAAAATAAAGAQLKHEHGRFGVGTSSGACIHQPSRPLQ